MSKFLHAVIFSTLVLGAPTFAASPSDDPRYLTINKTQWEFLGMQELSESPPHDTFATANFIEHIFLGPGDGAILDQIINIGQKAWDIVKANEPAVEANFSYAHAMPVGISDWQQMERWQKPRGYDYQFVAENLFGMQVVVSKYRVLFNYGGSLDGKGQYLANVTVVPTSLDVAWAYKVDLSTTVSAVFNTGTKKNPVAGMNIVARIKVTTPLKNLQEAQTYTITGAGEVVSQN